MVSAMATKDKNMVFELRTPQAATPQRVADAARMLAKALEASEPDLEDGSVTMVVRNLDMKIAVRAQKPAGRRALRDLSRLIAAPLQTIQREPVLKRTAEAVAKECRALAEMGIEVYLPGRASPVAKVDRDFVNAMEAAAQHTVPANELLRGTTETYGRVLRIGRTDERHSLMARIRFGGEARDIQVADNLATDALDLLFAAVKDGRLVRVEIEVTWLKTPEGEWAVDRRGALVTGVYDFDPATGAEFVDAAQSAIEPRSDEEILAIISDLETR